MDFKFRFQPLHFSPKNFQKTKLVQSNYFLHLEDLLLSDLENHSTHCPILENQSKNFIENDSSINFKESQPPCLLKLSFGDFNYPQTRYVLQTNHIEYFRETPLPTFLNHQAHMQLLKLIQNDFNPNKES